MQLPLATCAITAVCFNGITPRLVLILPPVASLTLLVWHSFVTLDDEVQYIWTRVTSSVVIQVSFLTPRFRLLQYA